METFPSYIYVLSLTNQQIDKKIEPIAPLCMWGNWSLQAIYETFVILGDACARSHRRRAYVYLQCRECGCGGASPVCQYYVTVSELEYRENQTRLCLPRNENWALGRRMSFGKKMGLQKFLGLHRHNAADEAESISSPLMDVL